MLTGKRRFDGRIAVSESALADSFPRAPLPPSARPQIGGRSSATEDENGGSTLSPTSVPPFDTTNARRP